MGESWKLYVMGCRGSWPVDGEAYQEYGGRTSCYILKKGSYALVVDCGTGLTSAGAILQGSQEVDVLLTHVHYDHLMGLLSFGVFPPSARKRFLGNFSAWFGTDTLQEFFRRPFWPYTPEFGEILDLPSPGGLRLTEELWLRLHPSSHPDGTSLFRVDMGQEGGAAGSGLCFAFDFEHSGAFPEELARGCGILFFDGMYEDAEYPLYRGYGHSTWEKGVEIARKLGIPRLVLTHHSPASEDERLSRREALAAEMLPGTRFARCGDVYQWEDGKWDLN